jgi:single-strand DNA-binding protein
MRNINRIVLTGGLTKDPDLRHTNAGTIVATLRIGYTTQRKQGGQWQERSNYIDVTDEETLGDTLERAA